MAEIDYSEVTDRIEAIYNSSTDGEKEVLRQVLTEIAEDGYSQTYQDIWLTDYKEIPVDIDTFLENDNYLGNATREGQSIFPYWRKVLHEIFDAGNRYSEVVFTGATRTGKTSTAITALAYMLYKLMCLRDPQKFFNKKDISTFSILFFNVTKSLAQGVAFKEFNTTLRSSPWFNAHGHFTDSEVNYYYIPEGGKISIDFGSSATHGLGKQIYCLIGDTRVKTDSGIKTLTELEDKKFRVLQYNPKTQQMEYSNETTCVLTKYINKTIRITLENGDVIEGTPEHKILLADGTYKRLCDLTEEDDIFEQ